MPWGLLLLVCRRLSGTWTISWLTSQIPMSLSQPSMAFEKKRFYTCALFRSPLSHAIIDLSQVSSLMSPAEV